MQQGNHSTVFKKRNVTIALKKLYPELDFRIHLRSNKNLYWLLTANCQLATANWFQALNSLIFSTSHVLSATLADSVMFFLRPVIFALSFTSAR